MIVQSTRIARNSGYQSLERHLLDKHDENECIRILSGDRAIFADAQAFADAKRCKYALRHLSISPDVPMSPSQLSDFVRSIDKEFGMGDQRPRIVVLHRKNDRVHFHIAVAEVDPFTGRVLDSRHDYSRLERLAREYEAANGERIQMSRQDRAVKGVEGFSARARQKAERNASAFDRTRLKLACAKGASELQVELQRQGLSVEHGEKGFILVASDGQFVAAAHRATGLRKNEFKTIWGAYRHDNTGPYGNGFVAGHSPYSQDRGPKCGKRPRGDRQTQLAPDIHLAVAKATNRPSARPFRPRRTDYSTLARRRAQWALFEQSLKVTDWDELLRLAEALTAALMMIVLGPKARLTARIHQAHKATGAAVNGNKSIGPMLRP